MDKNLIDKCFNNVKDKKPLVHCISNYVSLNDCANLLLACGALPIMADEPEEVSEVVSLADSLVLNMGMPSPRKIEAMIRAGKRANELGKPIVLDPVGVGVSNFRKDSCIQLLEEIKFDVIRANISEIKSIALGTKNISGVEASNSDKRQSHFNDNVEIAKKLSKRLDCVIVVSGKIDLVVYKDDFVKVFNGHEMMSKVTGTGCQLTSLIGAYISVNQENYFEAAFSASSVFALCGELAYNRLGDAFGNIAYREALIDSLYCLKSDEIIKGVRVDASN